MSSLQERGRNRKALPRMVRSQTSDSRSFQEVGAKSKNLKGVVEMAKRQCRASSQWKSMELGPFQHEKMGVGETQELGHANRRLQGPHRH